MFLNSLSKEQKSLFLELAIKAADVSGGISIEEKNMLKAFALEMHIEPMYATEKSVEEIMAKLLERSSPKDRKVIIFELLGIMYSDSEFDAVERKFILKVAELFELEKGLTDKMYEAIKKYAVIYSDICKIVIN